jgi:uncharacterized protein YndB with AHSA1/START domain
MAVTGEVRESLRVTAPADDVWRAFADPAWIAGWMAERASGRVVTGGTLELAWDSLGMAVELEVVAAEPPARLVLRAHPPGRPPQTQTAVLAPDGGATRVELIHGGFPPGARGDDERDGTRAGWHTQLRVLAHYLARYPGAARACAAAVAPVSATLDAVDEIVRAPDGLARWLTAAPARLGAEGERFDLALRGGTWLSGTVLSQAPPREVALAVDEIDGGLRLRAIALEPGGAALLVAAQAWSWAPDAAVWPTVRSELDEAVARLAGAAGSVPYNA